MRMGIERTPTRELRLAAEAVAGERSSSRPMRPPAGLDAALERRSLALKGKEGATEVVSLKVAPG